MLRFYRPRVQTLLQRVTPLTSAGSRGNGETGKWGKGEKERASLRRLFLGVQGWVRLFPVSEANIHRLISLRYIRHKFPLNILSRGESYLWGMEPIVPC